MNCFVKESHSVIWHFYHNSHGICYCKMTDENIGEYNVLLPEGQSDFDVIIDDFGYVHMVFQNFDGDILYANYYEDKWRRTTLMESKHRGYYPKNFVLKQAANQLHLLYTIQYNGRLMLTHQQISDPDVTPGVVDCIRDDFSVATDSAGNILVLFYSETQKKLGIKRYFQEKGVWGVFEEQNIDGECKNPFLYVDNNDHIHIVFQREMTVIEYFEGKESVLGTGQRPIMFYYNTDVVSWEGITDNKVYIKRKDDNVPTVIMSGGFSRPGRYKIRYTKYEYGLRGECCLGNIINGSVRLYGISNFFVVPYAPENKEEFLAKEYENQEFQKLKIRISHLESMVEKLQARAEEYENKKIDRRLHELETTVNKPYKNKIFGLF